jgi:hypothetical protein
MLDRVIGGTHGRQRFNEVYRRLYSVALSGPNYG